MSVARPDRRQAVALGLIGVGVLLVAGLIYWATRPVSLNRAVHASGLPLATSTTTGPPVDVAPQATVPTSTTVPAKAPAATVPPADPLAGAQMVVRIQSLGVAAAVVPVSNSPGGVLNPPENVHTLGWWDPGAYPGSDAGSAVIVGHVNSASQGNGALYDLGNLAAGAPITVTDTEGTHTFRTVSVQKAVKGTLPTSLFATTGSPQLVLITCGGAFDSHTGHYVDNIVAVADPE